MPFILGGAPRRGLQGDLNNDAGKKNILEGSQLENDPLGQKPPRPNADPTFPPIPKQAPDLKTPIDLRLEQLPPKVPAGELPILSPPAPDNANKLPGVLPLAPENRKGTSGPKIVEGSSASNAPPVIESKGTEFALEPKIQTGGPARFLPPTTSAGTPAIPTGLHGRKPPELPLNNRPDVPEHPVQRIVVEGNAGRHGDDRREPLERALGSFLSQRPEEALQHLRSYDRERQEILLQLLPVMANLARKPWSDWSPQDVELFRLQVESLLVVARPRMELAIPTMSLCDGVKSFGDFKPLPVDHTFQASTPQRPGELVQVYVEVKNFTSEARKDGYFETILASSLEIRDQVGNLKWSHSCEDQKLPILYRTQLHDYYKTFSFYVPQDLAPGTYKLTVQVEDQTNATHRRVARRTIDFRVGAVGNR